MKRKHYPTPYLLLASYAICATAIAQSTSVEDDLWRQLGERDAEISTLKKQLEQLRAQQPSASSATASAAPPGQAAAPSSPQNPQTAVPAGPGSAMSARSSTSDEDELSTALESSLVRQGGAVLQSGTIEIEPELSYFYDEPTTGGRRDFYGTALSIRYGLPGAMQADAYVPYVIRDHQAGLGSTSGIGDVRLGLTKQLVQDREGWPAVLVFGRWRIPTGDIDRTLPTGFGQHAIQLGVTATKRMDPVQLLGSVWYIANFGAAHLSNGTRVEAGDVFGARVGANLAATPDTSFFWGVSYNSNSAARTNGVPVDLTDRAQGFLELSGTTVIGRGRFFNLGIGLGVTPASPRFSVTASLPFRF